MFAPHAATNPADRDKTYWAARPHEDVITHCRRLTERYFAECTRSGLVWMWRTGIAQYFGQSPNRPGDFATQATARVGSEGQFTRFRVNEVRGYLRQLNSMAQGQRAAFQCLTRNSDHQALASIATSNNAVHYLYKGAVGEPGERRALEYLGCGGMAYSHVHWDPTMGDEIEVMRPVEDEEAGDGSILQIDVPAINDNGEPMLDDWGNPVTAKQDAEIEVKEMSGAPNGSILGPWDVVRDPRNPKMRWCIVRELVNKYDLAAKLPDLSEDILQAKDFDEFLPELLLGWASGDVIDEDTCMIEHLYHERCPAMPKGLYLAFLGDIVLWHGDCPLKKGVPIGELCPDRFFFKALGYSNSWDLLSIQEMLDQLSSDTATNLSTFGRQVMVFDKGADYGFNEIAKGLVAIAKTPGTDPPQAMNFAGMPAAVQWFFTHLLERMDAVSGLYATSRGKSDPNITSGRMAALYHSITYEYQNSIQAGFDDFRTQNANIVLELTRNNAPDKFLVEVAGKSEQPYLMEFRKEAMMGVARVQVETASPMMRSQAGRFEMWEAIKQVPPDRVDAVIRGINTGDWTGLYDSNSASDLRTVWENEQLQNGMPATVGAGDNPFKHMPQHWGLIEKLLTLPESNETRKAINVALSHLYEHMFQWQSIDPRLAMPLGVPLPPALPNSPTALMGMSGPMQAAPGGQAGTAPQDGGGTQESAPSALTDPNQPPQGRQVPPSPAANAAGVNTPTPSEAPSTIRPGSE
jgi:hypothetical protein